MRIESPAIRLELHVRIDVYIISTFSCISFHGFAFGLPYRIHVVNLGYFDMHFLAKVQSPGFEAAGIFTYFLCVKNIKMYFIWSSAWDMYLLARSLIFRLSHFLYSHFDLHSTERWVPGSVRDEWIYQRLTITDCYGVNDVFKTSTAETMLLWINSRYLPAEKVPNWQAKLGI